jgi:phenylacetate-coenzyme A ligase PaaK-like adenylate-forming protein
MTTTTNRGWSPVSAEELLAHDRWSREQLLAYQHERLHELIEHAISSSPYYRDALGRDALDDDVRLEDLPSLPKATLMEQFDRVLTDPQVRLEAVEAHASGPDPAALLAGRYHVFCTSGTTGRRGVFLQTPPEFEQWREAAWRVWARVGIPRGIRAVGFAAPTPLHITQKLFAGFGAFGRGRPALAVTTPLPQIVDGLNRDQPEALFGIPSLVGLLAAEQLDGRLAIEPRHVVLASEVLSEEVIRRIGDAWQIEPFQVYATTEALILGSESADRVGFHLSEDLVVVEVVDEHNRPVPPGVPGYKVLVTSLVNRTLPLIRYELADTVRWACGEDPGGRPYRRIECIDGRNDDVLRLPAARGGEAVVLPNNLRAPFAPLPDVIQYQIVREPDRIAVRVVLRPDASSETPARVLSGIRRALEDAGATAPPVEIEQVAEIEREPGGAKLKLVKSVG